MTKLIVEQLTTLVNYYVRTRARGHTELAKKSLTLDNLATLLVLTEEHGRSLDVPNSNYVTLTELERTVAGRNILLVLDNYTIVCLANDALTTIVRQQSTIKKLRDKLSSIHRMSDIPPTDLND